MENFNNIEGTVVDWGRGIKTIERSFLKKEKVFLKKLNDFPKKWLNFMIMTYFFTQVVSNKKYFTKYYKYAQEVLSSKELSVLAQWLQTPPCWSLFVVEDGDEKKFWVRDVLNGEKRIVESNSIYQRNKELDSENFIFLCFLFPNKDVWESYGIVHHFPYYYVNDFTEFINYVDSETYNKEGLTGFINNNYSKFFQICRNAYNPCLEKEGEPVIHCWTELVLDDFVPNNYMDILAIEKRNRDYLSLTNADENKISDFILYFNTKTSEALLYSITRQGYKDLVKILSKEYDIDEEPEHYISFQMSSILLEQLKIKLPINKWFAIFPNKESSSENKMKTNLNNYLFEYVDAKNNGKAFNLEEMAKKHNLSKDDKEAVKKVIEKSKINDEKTKIHIDGGFDYPIPPPVKQDELLNNIKDGDIFSLNMGEESYKYYKEFSSKDFSAEDFNRLIEIIYDFIYKEFGNIVYLVVNGFYYLLCHKKDKWVLASDYAAELIKLFGYIFIPSKYSIEEFISTFSKSILLYFVPCGFIEVEEKPLEKSTKTGDFKIRTTNFFNSYFNLKEKEGKK